MKFSDSIIITRPINQVFAHWADVERYPEWAAPVIERKKLSEGPVGVGTKFCAADKWPGRTVKFDMEITEFVQNERLSARWFEPMAGSWSSHLTETSNGTRLDFEIEISLPLMMRLISPLTKWWAKRENRKFMESFKNLMENTSA